MTYLWEPAASKFDPDTIGAEYAVGDFYDVLQVEYGNDGWRALILGWEDPYVDPDPNFYEEYDGPLDTTSGALLMDESLWPTKEAARAWCEKRDTIRYQDYSVADNVDDEPGDDEYWALMLEEDDDEAEDEFGR